MPTYPSVPFPLGGFLPEESRRVVSEPAREVPVAAEVDVAVFGGGPAGLCAAAAAAREGASVLLVERHGCLGGMATIANVNLWHSFYGTDRATPIIGGLPRELVQRLQARDAIYNAAPDGDTAHWVLDSEQLKFVADDLVLSSGVRLLLHTALAGALTDGRRVTAAFIEGKSGRQAVLARTFVDCTGDADLVRFAGVATELGDGAGHCQAPSLCFRLAPVAPDALGCGEVQAALYATPMDYNGERYPTLLWGDQWPGRPEERMLAGVRVVNVNTADSRDLTRAEVEGRYQLRWMLERLRTLPGWERAQLLDMAAQIGPRESHRILADHQLQRLEVLEGVRFPDAIAQGTYPIDIHTPDGPGIMFENLDGTRRHIAGDATATHTRWDGAAAEAPRRDTLCYQVPLRSLFPTALDNVLVAGRCSGATHESAGAIRVMVNCMQLGQAAGVTAALAGDGQVRGVVAERVRERLRALGMPLL